MAKRDILKEAIVDAKAVKEVAIANAKAALEEAFTPQLKSMLSAKLEEMEKEDDLEEMSSPIMRHGMEGDTDREERETEYMRDDMMEGDDMSYEDDLDEEFSIEEILAELERDTLNEAEEEEEEEVEVETETETETEEDTEDEDTETTELEDMTDDELKDFIEDVISDMVAAGELEAGESFETEEGEVEIDMDMGVEDDEELGFEVEDDEEEVEIMETTIRNKNIAIGKTNKSLREAKAKIRDLEKANKILSESNKEIQLLNAKLLYTNKIFKAKNLTENEKVKVLGAFDKASTIKESKLVFETLSEGLKAKKINKRPIKESLGRASKVTGNFNRTKKPIIATDPMVERFQKLAGLN